jgi:hypothetical protein
LSGNDLNASSPNESGFVVVCLLLGIGGGFASFDIYAGLDGYGWLGRHYINQTLIAMVVGGTLGLLVGLLLDTKIKTPPRRSSTAGWLWAMLCICVFLFIFLCPALQRAY